MIDELRETESDAFVARMGAARVLDVTGKCTRLYEAWGGRPAVQVFVRQFGCLFCHQLVDALIEALPALTARHAHLVLVGCGTPEQAHAFSQRHRLDRASVSLFTDPTRAAHGAAGLDHGLGKVLLAPRAWKAYGAARQEGYANGAIQGDVAQLGGVMVIEPPATLAFVHRSRHAGDHPVLSDLVAALDP